MRRRLYGTVTVLVVGGLAACASGAGSGLSMSSLSYSSEDLARAQQADMHDFLRDHLRVRLGRAGTRSALGVRHRGNFVNAALYVDGSEASEPISFLRQVRPSEVESLRILEPDEASARYGRMGRIAIIAIELNTP